MPRLTPLPLLLALACAPAPLPAPPPAPPPAAPSPTSPPITRWRLAPDGPSLVLTGPDTRARASVHVVAHIAGRPSVRAPIPSWTHAGGALVGQVTSAGVAWRVTLSGLDPLQLQIEATHLDAAPIALLALDLDLPDLAPEALDRAYRRASPSPAVDAGAYTPKVAWAGPFAFLARAEGLRTERTSSGARLRVVLDQAERHPLLLWSDCVAKADDLPSKRDRSARVASPGDRLTASVDVVVDARVPLPSRFKAPFRAAMAFTDHADQADAARLGALMFGRATAAAPLAHADDGRGFAGRGLSMTKTVFPLRARPYPPQLDDPAFVALLDALHGRGVEIGPHSASGAPDETPRTVEGLALLRSYRSRTWIDHQPNTNCEAVTNRGLLDGPHAVRAALQAEGYRYLWAGYDLPESGAHLNLFAPERPAAVIPVLHRHALSGDDLWFFHSMWRSWARPRFLAAYADDALDRLAAEHGLHVAHTYLDTYRPTGPLAPWTLLEPIDGGFVLRPEADAMFARLQTRQDRGELRVAGIGEIADHLLAVESLVWTVRGGALHLDAPSPIADLGLRIPDGTASASVAGVQASIVGDLLHVRALPAGGAVIEFDPPLGPLVAWEIGAAP